MRRNNIHFYFLNIGHFLDHLFVLIFATAVLKLALDWNLSYPDLLPYATPGMVAFGLGAIPAGWIADKWRRDGMMQVFFIGIGIASIACSFATTPEEMAVGLFVVGCFAAIYHPVGIAMVVQGRAKTGMPLAVNGVFGNLGVAAAPLLTGALLDFYDWKWAFIIPGVFSIAIGIAYSIFLKAGDQETLYPSEGSAVKGGAVSIDRDVIIRVFGIIFLTTALGGIIFQSTTYALPKIFEIRLQEMAASLTLVGIWSAFVFAMAAFAQLVVGYFVDKHSVRTIFAIVTATQAILFIIMINLFGAAALLISLAFMLVVFGQIPINDVLVGRVAKSEWRSRAYAARSFVTFSVMSFTLPSIAWLLNNRKTFDWAPQHWDQFAVVFVILAIAAALIFLLVLQLPKVAAITGVQSQTVE
tara:strand:+ start:69097 stop:70335 length:1239 start_codon:yes stop_codon:yes gene_type:complete